MIEPAMIETQASAQTNAPRILPRRRFLRRLGTLLGGLLAVSSLPGTPNPPDPTRSRTRGRTSAWTGHQAARRAPRERALAEADLYGPHDLAG